MVKKIKFPLELLNGEQVRTIEQLREYFDLEKVIAYFVSGKLTTWLEDRYYEEEAEEIARLNVNSKGFKRGLCRVLGVEYEVDNDIDINEIGARNERLNKLKQYTDDKCIIEQIDNVVFNQEELADILDNEVNTIYLCDGKFSIPVSKSNTTYIGIANTIITINSKNDIDFDSKNIIFNDITLRSDNKIDITVNKSKGLKYEGTLKANISKEKEEENRNEIRHMKINNRPKMRRIF